MRPVVGGLDGHGVDVDRVGRQLLDRVDGDGLLEGLLAHHLAALVVLELGVAVVGSSLEQTPTQKSLESMGGGRVLVGGRSQGFDSERVKRTVFR